jgi:hypothetical protein
MNTIPAVPAILSVFTALAFAAEPAPWYLWDSALDGKTQCAQFSPGKSWTKIDGSFKNSSCNTSQSQIAERQRKVLKPMGMNLTERPDK